LAILLTPEHVAFERVDAIEEQDAVEVVDLVQQAPGLEAARLHVCDLSAGQARLDHDVGRAAHVGGQVRDAQAALPCHLGAGRMGHHPVNQDQQPIVGLGAPMPTDVDGHDPHRLVDLGRGHTDASRVRAHRVDEVSCHAFHVLGPRQRGRALQRRSVPGWRSSGSSSAASST